MSDLPTDDKTSEDITAPVAQVVPSDHPHLKWMKNEISEEITRQISSGSETSMSDSTVSKDWIERKTSDLEHKIEIEKVKSEAKFDKLVSQSDAKFERLFSELKFESERNSLKIDSTSLKFDASIARLETNITRWMLGILFSILGLGFAVWRSSQPMHEVSDKPQSSIPQSAKQEQPTGAKQQ